VRKIKEVLKLKWHDGLSNRKIATSCNVSPSTVSDLVQRAAHAGLSWPSVQEMTDRALEELLYVGVSVRKPPDAMPNWQAVHKELSRPKVTLKLLWREYKEIQPDSFQYTQFCYHYRQWAKHLDVVMRQHHKAGEKLFVDWAGQTVPIHNPITGEISEAYLFVAALGASNYAFVRLYPSMELRNWIQAHCLAFEFFGGTPVIVVPDNLKTGITKPNYYDPDLNPTYADMARHYDVIVLPARVRKPNDKAKVESAVLHVERRILAALRDYTFFSVDEANDAIAEKLQEVNNEPFQKLDGSRTTWFLELDKPALSSLPEKRYEFRQWKKATVHMDYHVEFEKRFYSVPYKLVGKSVEVLATQTMVEIFYQGIPVAAHKRCGKFERFSTKSEHMPPSHQKYASRSPETMEAWAGQIGEHVQEWAHNLFERCRHPEQGYRAVLGVIRLSNKYTSERVNNACKRAIIYGAYSYRSVKSILEKGLDSVSPDHLTQTALPEHENVRGAEYYAVGGGESEWASNRH
jgi:transposase